MHFMDLPDDIFIEILDFLDEEWYQDRNAALGAVRRTCKRLLAVSHSQFFATFRLSIEGRKGDLPSLVTQARNVGHYVRDLNLDLWMDIDKFDEEKSDMKDSDVHLATLVSRLPNVRTLTIHTISNGVINLPQFVLSIRNLTRVQHLLVVETAYVKQPSFWVPTCCPVSDGVVREVVKASGNQLLSLVFEGQSQMAPETLNAIRMIPKNLQTLLLRDCIGIDCRAAICEEVPWACRHSLQHLGFYDCRGAHTGGIVAGIENGLWSTCLRTLEVCKSGDHSDARGLPYSSEWGTRGFTLQTLERAHFEHAFDWEIELMGRLRVREVTLTYLPKQKMIDITAAGAFQDMTKLITCKPSGSTVQLDDGILKAVCDTRDVELSLSGNPVLGCNCQYGID